MPDTPSPQISPDDSPAAPRQTAARQSVADGLCIGCGYCAGLTDGVMTRDAAGFLTPGRASLEADASDPLVRAACPARHGDHAATPGHGVDRIWGRALHVATGHSADPQIRHAGSSGGVLTALADWLIASGRVDRVLVTAYDPAYPIGTASDAQDARAPLIEAAGSKYAPAAPLAALAGLRDGTDRLAVIARPCDIATLRRAFAAGDPMAARIPILLSFFCAGTPSDDGNRALLRRMGVPDPGAVAAFRHRGQGWPGDTVARLTTGEDMRCSYGESWGQVLRRHTHDLCKICADGIGEAADIVAADAWYGDAQGYPTFDEAEGRSLIVARTDLGLSLLRAAEADGALCTTPLDIRQIDAMQPGQKARREQLGLRLWGYRLAGRAVPRVNAGAVRAYARGLGLRRRARVLAGTLRRALRHRWRAR